MSRADCLGIQQSIGLEIGKMELLGWALLIAAMGFARHSKELTMFMGLILLNWDEGYSGLEKDGF